MRLLSNRLMCQPVLLIVLRKSRMILTEGTESKEGLQNPSYLSWDGTGDEKGNTPAADSEKLVTVKRNRNIDPREQGKFLFWRGVNYCYVSEKCCQKCVRKCCQEKENSPLLVEGGCIKSFKQNGKESGMMEEKRNHVKTQMEMTVTV